MQKVIRGNLIYFQLKVIMSESGFQGFLTKQLPLIAGMYFGLKYLPKIFGDAKLKEYRPTYSLLGDVGGTNIRLQLVLVQPPRDQPLEVVKRDRLLVKQFDSFQGAIRKFLVDIPLEKYPELASIGIAGPVQDNSVFMSNVKKWGKLNGEVLSKDLGIKEFYFINDFIANSFGLLLMKEDNFISLNGKKMDENKIRGVLGPGTGLGNSVIYKAPFRKRQRIYVLPSEGGHTDFRYIDDQSVQFFKFYVDRSGYPYICHERSFCGPALPYMYQFFANKYPDYPDADRIPTGEQIVSEYLADQTADTISRKTAQLFLKLFCNAICHFMVTHMCTGGLYLVGSLTNAIWHKLQNMDITAEYKKRHPQMAQTIDRIPIVFSKELDLGLKGAYVYARRVIADQQHD